LDVVAWRKIKLEEKQNAAAAAGMLVVKVKKCVQILDFQ